MSTFMDTFGNRSSEIGDYIGTESGNDLKDIAGEKDVKLTVKDVDERQGRSRSTVRRQKREFPPPIPLLARTENLLPHMPWTLRRYYSGDGRLIIKEVRVPHHDYFRVNRSGGRLTLDLVPLDDEISLLGLGIQDKEIEEGNVELADKEEQLMNPTVVEEKSEVGIANSCEIEEKSKPAMVGGGAGKCWNYSGIQISSCFVPSITPVKI